MGRGLVTEGGRLRGPSLSTALGNGLSKEDRHFLILLDLLYHGIHDGNVIVRSPSLFIHVGQRSDGSRGGVGFARDGRVCRHDPRRLPGLRGRVGRFPCRRHQRVGIGVWLFLWRWLSSRSIGQHWHGFEVPLWQVWIRRWISRYHRLRRNLASKTPNQFGTRGQLKLRFLNFNFNPILDDDSTFAKPHGSPHKSGLWIGGYARLTTSRFQLVRIYQRL